MGLVGASGIGKVADDKQAGRFVVGIAWGALVVMGLVYAIWPTITTLLILHGLIAVALMGGITHQAMAACWPARTADTFVDSFRAVNAARYTNANIVLFIVVFVLGAVVYPSYRIVVSPYLVNARLTAINGGFEVKEQFAAVALGMLPLYWLVWRQPLEPRHATARAAITAMLCFVVWYSFLVGHILNNVRGVFGR